MPGHVTGHSRGVQVATGREWRYQEERLWWWHLVCHGQMQQLQGVLADRRLPESGASRFACGGDYQMIVSIQFSSFACLHRNHWGIYTQKDFPLMYLPDTKQCTVVERVSFRLTTSYKRPHHISLLFLSIEFQIQLSGRSSDESLIGVSVLLVGVLGQEMRGAVKQAPNCLTCCLTVNVWGSQEAMPLCW